MSHNNRVDYITELGQQRQQEEQVDGTLPMFTIDEAKTERPPDTMSHLVCRLKRQERRESLLGRSCIGRIRTCFLSHDLLDDLFIVRVIRGLLFMCMCKVL